MIYIEFLWWLCGLILPDNTFLNLFSSPLITVLYTAEFGCNKSLVRHYGSKDGRNMDNVCNNDVSDVKSDFMPFSVSTFSCHLLGYFDSQSRSASSKKPQLPRASHVIVYFIQNKHLSFLWPTFGGREWRAAFLRTATLHQQYQLFINKKASMPMPHQSPFIKDLLEDMSRNAHLIKQLSSCKLLLLAHVASEEKADPVADIKECSVLESTMDYNFSVHSCSENTTQKLCRCWISSESMHAFQCLIMWGRCILIPNCIQPYAE